MRLRGFGTTATGQRERVLLLFSSRLGCLGSLLVSAVLTLLVLLLLDVI